MKITQTMIHRAFNFAANAHMDQIRKYKKEPYIVHHYAVSEVLAHYGFSELTIVGGMLHDVIEDTNVDYIDIQKAFNVNVADLVSEVTNPEKLYGANRAENKAEIRRFFSLASAAAQNIKCADMMHNIPSIVKHGSEEFSKIYLNEKKLLLQVMRKSDQSIWDDANEMVEFFIKYLEEVDNV